jgi:hypothetical protein
VARVDVVAGDSLLAFAANRMSVFTRDHRFVRASPYPANTVQHVHLPDGRMIVSARITSPDKIGLPLHLLSPLGEIVNSFGSEAPSVPAGSSNVSQMRALSPQPGRPDVIWAVHSTRYEIEQWSISGRLLLRMVRQAEWFEPWLRHEPGVVRPQVIQARVDSLRRMWVWALIPDSSGRGPVATVGSRPSLYAQFNARYDSVLEVIDLASGRLIAAHQTAEPGFTIVADDVMLSQRELASGHIVRDVWKVRIVR